MRKFLCAFFILFGFSLFAQETPDSSESETSGTVSASENENQEAQTENTLPAPSKAAPEEDDDDEIDLSQDALAKSTSPVNAVAWTRDGKYFATSWNNSVILWNAASNTIAAVYSNFVSDNSNPLANVTSLQFTGDGQYMLSVRDDNTALVHSVGTRSDSTLITGTGSSIPDAVYAGDYRILIALDGQNLYESYRLSENGNFAIEEKLDFTDGIWGLSQSPSGKRVLVTSESGAIHLVDTVSWEVLAEFDCYTLSRIKPRFAEDGVHFVAAKDANTLLFKATTEDSDFLTIEERAGFSYCAEISSDCKKIAAGVNTGYVKIYDIASGAEENRFKLIYGDSAKSLAFSPDGEYVIIGTEMGYIYRWVLSGKPFVPEDERTGGLQNSLILSVGYSRLGTNYYLGSALLGVGYRNYFRSHFYWGLNGNLGAGVPGGDFPYTYYENGESLSQPFVYTIAFGGMFGLVYYNENYDLHIFSEAGLGADMRFLYNNSINYPHASKPYFGGFGELLVGLQWKWARLWGGVQFDSNLHWLTKVQLGVAMPTLTFRKKKQSQ